MASAKQDKNSVKTLIATSSSDGVTPINLIADPATHVLQVSSASASDLLTPNARRDANSHPVIMAASSSDGTTPVAVYCDSNGQILIN